LDLVHQSFGTILNNVSLLITDDMTVNSQRDSGVGVSQLPLHHGRTRSGCEQGTGRTVPHRMEPSAGNLQSIEYRMQLLFPQFVR
jgi:hypothetical protein